MKKSLHLLRKAFFLTMGTVLLATFFSCKAKLQNTEGKISIVTSIFPEYDWLMNVAGPNNDSIIPKLIVKSGVDVHSYQPSAKDIIDITTADILLYIGGESENWITQALKNKSNPDMIVINLMEKLQDNLKKEEIVQGMQEDESNEENDDELDEHIWFSISNVKIAVTELSNALCQKDPENAQMYEQRLQKYIENLNQLDEKIRTTLQNCSKDTIVVCDRFPFRYFTDDYNLKYFAAFPGCSAESEASFETISFLASKIDEINTNNVIILESSKDKLAKSIINASSHKLADILVLDSMQSTTLIQIFNGKTYIKTMESNLEILEKALN